LTVDAYNDTVLMHRFKKLIEVAYFVERTYASFLFSLVIYIRMDVELQYVIRPLAMCSIDCLSHSYHIAQMLKRSSSKRPPSQSAGKSPSTQHLTFSPETCHISYYMAVGCHRLKAGMQRDAPYHKSMSKFRRDSCRKKQTNHGKQEQTNRGHIS